MSMSKRSLDRIAKADIVVVIRAIMGEKSIRRRESNQHEFLGLCPFHREGIPSFTVNTTKQFYHCYGCGAHGNAVNFVQEYGGLERVEALLVVAKIIGAHVPSGKTKLVRARRRGRGRVSKSFTRGKVVPVRLERSLDVTGMIDLECAGDSQLYDDSIPF